MAMVKMILFLALSFFLQEAFGGIICEQLPMQLCSYSVSASGKRCLLENSAESDGTVKYQCNTSEVLVDVIHDWVETDECIDACGVDRISVGISSDSLTQPQFTAKLCSDACHQNCPNIVDFYFNLALGEGVYLPTLCQAQQINLRRAMSDIKSSGVASVPSSSTGYGGYWGPAPSPTAYGEDLSPAPSPGIWDEASASSSTGYGGYWGPAPSQSPATSQPSYGGYWGPAPSPTGYGEDLSPAPSPGIWDEASASSSTGYGGYWGPAPAPSPTAYGEDLSPAPSPTSYGKSRNPAPSPTWF